MTFTPYSPNPILLRPSSCETLYGWLRCPECGQALRMRSDGKGWNCLPCDILATDDKRLRAKFGGDDAER